MDTKTAVWVSTRTAEKIVLRETRKFSRKFGVVSAPAQYKNRAVIVGVLSWVPLWVVGALGCNKWRFKGCPAALPGNRPKSAFFALFLPFSGGCKELGNPENGEERLKNFRYPQISLNPHLSNPHLRLSRFVGSSFAFASSVHRQGSVPAGCGDRSLPLCCQDPSTSGRGWQTQNSLS